MASPKITIQEFDGAQFNNSQSACITFFAGKFEKGPGVSPVLINSALQFKHVFGRAIETNKNDWYQVYNYLQYPNNPGILVTRAIAQDSYNAVCSKPFKSSKTKILDQIDYDLQADTFLESNNLIKIAARSPGEWGNLLDIHIFTKQELNDNKLLKNGIYTTNVIDYIKEGYYCIVVFRNDVIVELFTIKYNDIETINRTSNYIFLKQKFLDYKIYDGNLYYVDGNDIVADGNKEHDLKPVFYGTNSLKLEGGISGDPTEADLLEAYEYVSNPEEYNINLIIANERYPQAAVRLAEKRKDTVCIIGTQQKFKDLTTFKNYANTVYSKYSYLIANYKKQFDNFSKKNIWVNFAGDIAGLRARLIEQYGLTESHSKMLYNLLNVEGIDTNYSLAFRDLLYEYNINSVVQSQGIYYVLGEKLLKDDSAGDFTTRLILNDIETKCSKIARYFVFEFNDYFARASLKSNINNVLRDAKAEGGIVDYMVVCDITNNTNDIIDEKKMVCDVYIKPKYLIEYIHLRFVSI